MPPNDTDTVVRGPRNPPRPEPLRRDPRLRLALGLLAALAALAAVVAAGWTAALDRAVTLAAAGARTPLRNTLAVNLTSLGSAPVVTLIAVGAAAYAVSAGRPRLVLAVAWTPLVFLTNEALKLLVHHPRPTVAMIALPPSYSFPSGHTAASSALFLTLAFMATAVERRAGPRRLIVGMGLALALLVAWSRVYLGVHYFTDVCGGLLLGAAGALIASRMFVYQPTEPRRETSPRMLKKE
jgi:membrane-associated phospholipid phosphatase